jgi:hypothetical protein
LNPKRVQLALLRAELPEEVKTEAASQVDDPVPNGYTPSDIW